ncbi:MAG TPA: cytochrome c oxidase assembly protein [Acidimicrobiales bacterium]|nr:cytochrome c oxidase assembly protein [Acidimicrobiales bacterium]
MTAAPGALALHRHAAGAGPWTFHLHPVAWLAIAALVLAYALAARRVARRAGPAALPARRQRLLLAGAVAALVLALTWPLADLAAHWSLTALVVQRLLLTLAVAPLLLLATPVPVLAALTRPAPLDACLAVLTRPVVAVVAFSAVAVGTLLTPAVAAQASSPWWRGAIAATLVLGGAVLWGPALRRVPGAHRTLPVALAAYLFVQSVVPTFPAIVYVFARHPLYPAFAGAHRAIGLSPLVDQQLAGVVAKVATLPVLWSAAWAALARAQRVEAAAGDDEPLTWAEVERQLERAGRAERRGRPGLYRRLKYGAHAPAASALPAGTDIPHSRADGPGPPGP